MFTGIEALFFVGIAALFPLAKQYNTTPSEILNLTSKYVFFLLCVRKTLYLRSEAGLYFSSVSS